MEQFKTITGKDFEAARIFLKNGLVVGIPTETVYGLAANALSEDAALKIFNIKNRPHFDPLIVHTHSIDEFDRYVTDIPDKARVLMQQFMPGPLTLVLKKRAVIPDMITSGLNTVGIRIPNHPLTLELLRELPFPLAAPSANPFGYISPTTPEHVYEQLHGKIPYILNGGPTTIGVESTIVGFEGDEAVIYRLGGLPLEQIERVIGKAILNVEGGSNPKMPGMLKSHYAPAKQLIFDAPAELEKIKNSKLKAGVICFDTPVEGLYNAQQEILSVISDLDEAAKQLFAAMRRLDASDADIIYAIKFPDIALGRAINDRLKRAAAR